MSYDVVSIPAGTNQFFLAYCLSYLLPTIQNESAFIEGVKSLFGSVSEGTQEELLADLKAFSSSYVPRCLVALTQQNIRPRLAEYIEAHQDDYHYHLGSDADVMQVIDALRSGTHFFGALEEDAVVQFTGIPLMLHHDARRTPSDLLVSMDRAAHLNFRDDCYECLLHPDTLFAALRQQLFPHVLYPVRGRDAVNFEPLRQALFEREINATLLGIEKELQAFKTQDIGSNNSQYESSFRLFSGWFPEQQVVTYAPPLSARRDEHVVSITSSASEQIVMNAFSLYRSSAVFTPIHFNRPILASLCLISAILVMFERSYNNNWVNFLPVTVTIALLIPWVIYQTVHALRYEEMLQSLSTQLQKRSYEQVAFELDRVLNQLLDASDPGRIFPFLFRALYAEQHNAFSEAA